MPRAATPSGTTATAEAIHSLAIRLLRKLRTEDVKTGVPPGRLSALSVLVFAGPQRLTDLARIEQVKAPTMTKIVAGMEGEGLARRQADPADARVARVQATARGRKILLEGRDRRVRKLAQGLKDLPSGDLETLEKAARILREVVEAL